MFAYLPTLLLAATAVVADYNPIFSREALSAMTAHDAGQNCAAHQSLVCCDKTEKCSTLDMGSKWHPYTTDMTDAELTLFTLEVKNLLLLSKKYTAKVACYKFSANIKGSKNVSIARLQSDGDDDANSSCAVG